MVLSDVLLTIGRLLIAFMGYGFAGTVILLLFVLWVDAARAGKRARYGDDVVGTSAAGMLMAFIATVVTTIILKALS